MASSFLFAHLNLSFFGCFFVKADILRLADSLLRYRKEELKLTWLSVEGFSDDS